MSSGSIAAGVVVTAEGLAAFGVEGACACANTGPVAIRAARTAAVVVWMDECWGFMARVCGRHRTGSGFRGTEASDVLRDGLQVAELDEDRLQGRHQGVDLPVQGRELWRFQGDLEGRMGQAGD